MGGSKYAAGGLQKSQKKNVPPPVYFEPESSLETFALSTCLKKAIHN